MPQQSKEQIRIYAMGGVGEIGNNMTVIEINNDLFIVDAGIMNPKDDMLGVDSVIPDTAYLEENKDRVKAVFLTHAHQAHIGGLPYFLKKTQVPVYGTKFTLSVLELKLREEKMNKKVKTFVIDPDKDLKIGKHRISFFRTTHSVPDAVGMAFHTSQGAVVITGDFKFDYTPVDDKRFDIDKVSRLGDEGILCLLSDSKNAERRGKTPSEAVVGTKLEDIFYFAKGRVVTAVYASNIHRIQQIIDAAVANRRKVALDGRYLELMVGMATKLGYLNVPKRTFTSMEKINNRKDHEVAIITSGFDGEPMTPLERIAEGSHKTLQLKENDLFIYASSAAPGSEKTVTTAIDAIMRKGVHVVYDDNVHVSGHGSEEDLKLMLQLARPKYLIPVHGDFRMQKSHGKLATATGMRPDQIFLIDKGDVVEFTDQEGRQTEKVPVGHVLVDGKGVGDVGNIVLRDRRLLAEDGTLIVVVTLAKRDKRILSGPEIITRGFVYVRESEALIEDAGKIVSEVLHKSLNQNVSEWSSLKSNIRDSLSRYLYDKTKRRPMILPIIMEV